MSGQGKPRWRRLLKPDGWLLLCMMLFPATNLVAATDDTASRTVVLANGEWAPYQSPQLPYDGVASRIVSAAFATQGLTVKYVFLPWKRAYYMTSKGQFDGTLVWRDSAEREKQFRVSEPLFVGETVFFHTRDKPFSWSTLADLKGERVGETLGYLYTPLDKAGEQGLIHTERAPTDVINLQKLVHGRIDLFPCDLMACNWLLKNRLSASEAEYVTWSPTPLEVVSYHVLLHRDSARSKFLLKSLNKGLAILRRQGLIQQWLRALPTSDAVTESLRSRSSGPLQTGG